jgi:hypothetical protein
MRDLRVYVYSGYSVLKKPQVYNFHKFNSLKIAKARIEEVRKLGHFKNRQLVLIDYDTKPSRIILIDDDTV